MSTTVIFGDVHGQSRQLASLIDDARARFSEPTFVSVGDLIDRGPDSKGVLDVCIRENVRGVCGNHELWFASVLGGDRMNDGVYQPIMGGLATLASYGLSRGDPDHVGPALRRTVPQSHKEWILNLPSALTVVSGGVTYLITHAGIPRSNWERVQAKHPGLLPGRMAEKVLLDSPDAFFWAGAAPKDPDQVAKIPGVVQVFGHHVVYGVVRHAHYIALDTGCGTAHPRILSALVLRDDALPEIIQSV